MALTASELRQNVYRLLDQVLETGVPLEITRGDGTLRIVAVNPPKKLSGLPLRNLFSCDPDELVGALSGTKEPIPAGMEPCT